jgi:small-conductance mechanosensitive channel
MPDAPAADAAKTLAEHGATLVAAPSRPFLETILSNSLHAWIVSGATLVACILIFYLLRVFLLSRLAKFAERTKSKWDDIVIEVCRRIRFWLIFPAMLHFSMQILELPGVLDKTIKVLMFVGLGIQLLIMAQRVIDAGLEVLIRRASNHDGSPDPTVASSLGIIRVLALGMLAIVVVLVALDNLGFEIKSLLTGLGIGGIAIALAVQSILGDLFGSLTIILDKPFVVGDFIAVGDKMGTVERIGIKTTRVRALSGEQLVFANSDLLASRVQNFKRMQERRVVFTIGVTYETPSDKLRAIPEMIRAAIQSQSNVRVDRVHFKSFGSYSLDFETVYFVLSPDFNNYMDIQQAVNLTLLDRFAAESIEFAYPTQVEYHREPTSPAPSPAPLPPQPPTQRPPPTAPGTSPTR